jgi:membrane fusion protein (multidrug efflux system)
MANEDHPGSTKEQPPASASGKEQNAASRRARLRRYSRSKLGRPFVLVPLALLVVAGVILAWHYFATHASTDDAQVDVHLYPVSARISGYVIRVNVDDNQYVQQGSCLVEIDPRDYEVAVDKAKADVDSAEATAKSLNITVPITSVNTSSQLSSTSSDVESAAAGIVAAEKQLDAVHAQLQQAEANDVKAQDDLQRYKLLVEKLNVSEQTYDQALAAARASTAAVAGARANELAAQQAVRQAKDRLAQAEANHRAAQTGPQQVASTNSRALAALADVQQKRAVLEQAQLNLQYTKIIAPVSGEVNKTVVVGLNVQPGQQLLTVVPLQEVWVTANFKETQLRGMKPGQRAAIDVDSNGKRYKGHIDSIAGATGPLFSLLPPENATGNYVKIVQRLPVKIILDPGENRDLQLRPGMNVVPTVYLQ